MWKRAWAWLLHCQKIASSFRVENADDIYTDRCNYQIPNSPMQFFLPKSFFVINICNMWRKHFKSMRFLIMHYFIILMWFYQYFLVHIDLYIFQKTMEANWSRNHTDSVTWFLSHDCSLFQNVLHCYWIPLLFHVFLPFCTSIIII